MSVLILVVLLLFGAVAPLAAQPAAPTADIKVDQVGYLTGAPKVAAVASPKAGDAFLVRRTDDGKVAFRGKIGAPVRDETSGDEVRALDFSGLDTPGRYYVEVPEVGVSWPFRIGADVYGRAFYLAMRSYYGLRCGTAVDLGKEYPGYRHDACHLDNAFHATSGKSGPKAVGNKGWHDAGDYGRYVVNSGITTGTLLWAYEMFGDRAGAVKLDIPESGNRVPDLLDEIRWNLDWMLSMQDEDGGVFHKQTSETFCPFVMPERDTLTSYVIGTGSAPYKSSCATADFAAVMAIAARVYAPFDQAYAQTTRTAAARAFAWVTANPAVLYSNPKGIATGGYGDNDCSDEILWAAAELWRTTREQPYQQYFTERFGAFLPKINASAPPEWAHVAPMALWTYVLGGGTGEAAKAIKEASTAAADAIVARTAASGYRHSMGTDNYIWGSNGVAANYGLQLVVADAIAHDARYRAAAADNLHYLLGRNAFSISWVTQLGANPFRHPHHRPSGADTNAEPWPGLLSGGPNRSKQDPAMRKLPDLPPAKMYVDDQESFASNENAINWNAPLVFLLAAQLPKADGSAWVPRYESPCRFCGR